MKEYLLLSIEDKTQFIQKTPVLTTIQPIQQNLAIGFFWGNGQIVIPSSFFQEKMNDAEKILFVQKFQILFQEAFEEGFERFQDGNYLNNTFEEVMNKYSYPYNMFYWVGFQLSSYYLT